MRWSLASRTCAIFSLTASRPTSTNIRGRRTSLRLLSPHWKWSHAPGVLNVSPFYFSFALSLFAATCHSLAAQDAARQRAAIQAACRSGTLTLSECQSKLAALDPEPALAPGGPSVPLDDANYPPAARGIPGATTFRHPGGLYTISVPPGWAVDSSQANPKFTHGDTWLILETSASNSTAQQVARKGANEIATMLQGFRITDQGDFMTRYSHAASGLTANATVPARNGQQARTFVFWTQTDGQQHFVTLTASMDQATAPQTITLLMQVFNSLRFANE